MSGIYKKGWNRGILFIVPEQSKDVQVFYGGKRMKITLKDGSVKEYAESEIYH